MTESDFITSERAVTLPGLFRERVRRTPDRVAYKHFDSAGQTWVDSSWREMESEIGRWQSALSRTGLRPGDRVAMMLPNSREWVLFDQAAMGLGFVTVPLYTDDRAENAAYILQNAGARLVLVEGKHQWQALLETDRGLPTVEHILTLAPVADGERAVDSRVQSLHEWLPEDVAPARRVDVSPDTLATIVYTSGTTGHPKGVMLSHKNILSNASYALKSVDLRKEAETFLSFLPLSHTLERTIGYYLAIMVGGTVAFNRSVKQLPEDLMHIRPTVLISVPRIYERVYTRVMESVPNQSALRRVLFRLTLQTGWRRCLHRQGQASWSPWLVLWPALSRLVASKIIGRLGGRIRFAICGGAALQPDINRFFVSMGLPLL
ncbi:MAG TPA: AMP-binding protein, partial [Gammaproteobacteria bacterium]